MFCTEEVITAYGTSAESTLWIVDVNGGDPVQLEPRFAFQPAWSPSGDRIAFWTNINGQRDLATVPAAGGPQVMVTADAAVDWAPAWSPDGQFLYFASDRGGSMGIWRIPVDEASGSARGPAEQVAAGVDVAMDLPRLSADGRALIFRALIQSVNPAAIELDPVSGRAGAVRLLQHRTGRLVPTDVSPDGRWIALVNRRERQQDIFIMRPDGTRLTRLTDDLARDWAGRFTADSSALTFYSNREGTYDAWSMRLDGSNRTRLTSIPGEEVNFTMFAPDGQRLMATLNGGTVVIGTAPWPLTGPAAGEIAIPALAVGEGSLIPSFWSRDGRWLSGGIQLPSGAIAGNALYDVAARTVRQLSDDAGNFDVAWMPGQTHVAYFTAAGALMIQDITSLARRELTVPLPLPPDDDLSIAASPDGRTLYYGAQRMEANIWKVERSSAVR